MIFFFIFNVCMVYLFTFYLWLNYLCFAFEMRFLQATFIFNLPLLKIIHFIIHFLFDSSDYFYIFLFLTSYGFLEHFLGIPS